MIKQYNMSWKEFDIRCIAIAKEIQSDKKIKSIYGIPRGGLPAAVELSHLTGLPLILKPNKNNTVIIDDCVDSGATKKAFKNFKYFKVLIDKQLEEIDAWIIFPWEAKK